MGIEQENTGDSLTLTVGEDNLAGTSADDTFDAPVNNAVGAANPSD